MPNNRKYILNKAISHVLGDNRKIVLLIIFLIVSISWIGDLLLKLLDHWLSLNIQKEIDVDLSILLLSVLFLLGLINYSGITKYSYRYKAFNIDPERHNRKKLIISLSGFSSKKQTEHPEKRTSDAQLEEMMSKLEHLSPETPITELTGCDFDCNWVPSLQAIKHYQNLDEVIVLTTSVGGHSSFHQFQAFQSFVTHYFKNSNQNFSINSHITSGYIKSKELSQKVESGIPSDDPFIFAKTVLEILDTIEDNNKEDKTYIQNKVVIDVTGGKASMSAALGAISGSQGIFLHYMDTDSRESHELDISAS